MLDSNIDNSWPAISSRAYLAKVTQANQAQTFLKLYKLMCYKNKDRRFHWTSFSKQPNYKHIYNILRAQDKGKNLTLLQDSNQWPPRYQWDVLTTELQQDSRVVSTCKRQLFPFFYLGKWCLWSPIANDVIVSCCFSRIRGLHSS